MKIEDGRIGDIVKVYDNDNYGYISGLDLNPQKEVIFLITWANGTSETPYHPANLKKISM